MKKATHHLHTVSIAGSLIFGLLLGSGATAATSYLQELEAEAATINSDAQPETPAATPSWQTQHTTSAGEKLDPGLNKEQFEESLKSRFYGSYVFYTNLNEIKRQVVYEEYKKKNDIEHLREVIKAQLTN